MENTTIVALQPIVNIDSENIKQLYFKVLKGVSEIGFDVCASLVDGHRTNMKLYRELGGGKKIFLLPNRSENLRFSEEKGLMSI